MMWGGMSWGHRRYWSVEDDPMIGLDLQSILQGHGCEIVGPSTTIAEAFNEIETSEVDVALVDYLLGKDDAHPLAMALDARGIPSTLSTGLQEGVSASYPNTTILIKPYIPHNVCRVVDSLIAARLAR
jgi:DNA-binding NarL/FixJ family response regulator